MTSSAVNSTILLNREEKPLDKRVEVLRERRITVLAQAIKAQQEHQLLQEMDYVRADLRVVGGRCTGGADWGSDIADQASHMVELSTSGALRRLYQQKLRQLEQAWARCCSGQYGICESCGSQIDPARLNALPDATFCIRCQRQRECQR